MPPKFEPVETDNGIRGDTSMEKLAKLRPAFDKRFGTITAGFAALMRVNRVLANIDHHLYRLARAESPDLVV